MMEIGAGLVWTANLVVFLSLFSIWNKGDLLNLCLKMLFLGFAVVNAAPAWTFLQQALR
jgi:hypothetical protein